MAHETWGWQVEPCRDGRNFKLVHDYAHEIEIVPREHRLPEVQDLLAKYAGRYAIHCKAGFIFDGSSTPMFIWLDGDKVLMPPMTGKHTHASLLHDWPYVHKNILKWIDGDWVEISCPKELADLIFLEVMREDGFGKDHPDLDEIAWGMVKNHGGGHWDD